MPLFDWGGAEGLLPSWDGDRFLAAIDEPASPITILLNWKPSE